MKEQVKKNILFLSRRLESLKRAEALLNIATDRISGVFMPDLIGFIFRNKIITLHDDLGLNKDDIDSFRADIGQTIKTWIERCVELTEADLDDLLDEKYK